MPEQEDSGFKVTDRRKYNPDGSPRDAGELGTSPAAVDAEAQPPNPEPATDNVASLPDEAVMEQPEPLPEPEAASETKATAPPQNPSQAAAGHAEEAYKQASGPRSSQLPEASFLTLANMLAVEAAMHLGLIQNPGDLAPQVDLESARHLIDMLGMLQAKTRGNLTAEENDLLEDILADLRMQFVAISKRQ